MRVARPVRRRVVGVVARRFGWRAASNVEPRPCVARADRRARAAGGVVANLTYADPTADGYLAAYPAGGAQPATSSANPSVIRGFGANAMVTGLSDASFDLYASVSTDAVVDVWGWFTS